MLFRLTTNWYLVQTNVRPEYLNSVENCQSANLAYRLIFELGTLYTNPYINMCLVLNTILYNKNKTFTINGTKITIKSLPGEVVSFFVSEKPLCKGIYSLEDIKDSFVNICNSVYKGGMDGLTPLILMLHMNMFLLFMILHKRKMCKY